MSSVLLKQANLFMILHNTRKPQERWKGVWDSNCIKEWSNSNFRNWKECALHTKDGKLETLILVYYKGYGIHTT